MDSIRNEKKFLVVGILAISGHRCVSILGEVAGVRLLAVHDQDSAADLVGILQDRLIHEGLASDHISPVIGVQ